MFHFHINVSADMAKQEDLSNQILDKVDYIMSNIQDIKAALAQAKQDAINERAEVQARDQEQIANVTSLNEKVTTLTDEVQALRDQIATGQAVTQEDLDSILSTVSDVSGAVKDISEALPEPTEPVDPNQPAE